MVLRFRLKCLALLIGLVLYILGVYPHMAYAQSAWLSNHLMAKKIERLPDNTIAITEYPIISSLSGPGPFRFDSCTQIITARGKHKVILQIVQDNNNKILQNHPYTIEADYDGYIDGRICHWMFTSKESGWVKMEILLDNNSKTPEIIGTFYFYIYYEK